MHSKKGEKYSSHGPSPCGVSTPWDRSEPAPGGYRFILVAVDKFTKWIEIRSVVKVTLEEVAKFMQDITHCFSVPNRIITDLGTTFTGSAFWDLC
jgi:hypothetical protein